MNARDVVTAVPVVGTTVRPPPKPGPGRIPAADVQAVLDGTRRVEARRARGRHDLTDRVLALIEDSVGEPLSDGLRADAEARLDAPLGPVHVHTDPAAARAAEALSADAFTIGTHVFFGADRFRPETAAGHSLLLHELWHAAHPAPPGAAREVSLPGDPAEALAERFVAQAVPDAPAAGPPVAAEAPSLTASARVARRAAVADTNARDERLRTLAARALHAQPSELPTVVGRLLERADLLEEPLALDVSDDALLRQLDAGERPDVPVSDTPATAAPEAAPAAPPAAAPALDAPPPLVEATVESAPAEALVEGAAPEAVEGTPAEGAPAEPVPVEPIMPPAPEGLSSADTTRIGGVQAQAGGAARATTAVPAAGASVGAARGAVEEPAAETAARSEAQVAAVLEERPPPSPEIEALAAKILKAIRDKRPASEDELFKARPAEAVKAVGNQQVGTLNTEAQGVAGAYDQMGSPPAGQPATTPQPIADTPEQAQTGPVDVPKAVPDAVPAENVSLDADKAAADKKISDAGMTTEPATLSAQGDPQGSVARAQGASGELATAAAEDPAKVLADQDKARQQAEADMVKLRAEALAAMAGDRTANVQGVAGQQQAMVKAEANTREGVARQMRTIFDGAKTKVDKLLEPLETNARAKWDTGIQRLSTTFETRLSEVKKWIDDRHKGIGGAALYVWDALAGLPKWVTDAYDKAEMDFGVGATDLLKDISRDVNQIIQACQALIKKAKDDIKELVDKLPADLKTWAEGEAETIQADLDGLGKKVEATRTKINQGLMEAATTAVHEARSKIEELRKKAGGLLGMIVAAVNEFLENPAKAIINGLLRLVGIEPSAFWSVVDKLGAVIDGIADKPLAFATNLLKAVGQGFSKFFDNLGKHLLQGLLDWLFSGLKGQVTVPRDLSIKSVVGFFLELMGLTWANIRKIVVKYVGEKNVALVEKVWSLVSLLIDKGPGGILEMIKDFLDPQNLFELVMQAAIEYVVQVVATQVAARILMLFNPVGAIAQAIEAIYKVLAWVFRNAARIFTLVEAIVGGAFDILNGNFAGTANKVEFGLGKLIPIVIDFLAGFVGLSGVPKKVADIIGGLQEKVLGYVEKAIKWLVEKGKTLLAKLGLGGKQDGAANVEGHQSFKMGREQHEVWVDLQGASFKVMMASAVPKVLGTVLAQLAAERKDKDSQDKIAVARGALTALETAVTKANADGVKPDEVPDILAARGTLAAALSALGLDLLAKYASEIDQLPPGTKEVVVRALTEPKAEYAGAATWADLKGLLAEHEPKLKLMVAQPLSKTASPFGTKDAHPVGVAAWKIAWTHRKPGAEKPDEESSLNASKARIHARDAAYPNSMDRLLEFAWSEAGRSAVSSTLTTEQTAVVQKIKRAHEEWTPEEVSQKGAPDAEGIIPLTYRTRSGASFVVRIGDLATKHSVKGAGLKLKEDLLIDGRGKMRDLTDAERGNLREMGLARAHLVADRFGGPGHEVAANLMLTSAHYNGVEMGARENAIAAWIRSLGAKPGNPKLVVTFDLDVSIRAVAFTEKVPDFVRKKILASNLQKFKDLVTSVDPARTRDEGEILDEAIKAFAAKADALGLPLQRVLRTTYTASATTQDTVTGALTPHKPPGPPWGVAGIDLWLGLGE